MRTQSYPCCGNPCGIAARMLLVFLRLSCAFLQICQSLRSSFCAWDAPAASRKQYRAPLRIAARGLCPPRSTQCPFGSRLFFCRSDLLPSAPEGCFFITRKSSGRGPRTAFLHTAGHNTYFACIRLCRADGIRRSRNALYRFFRGDAVSRLRTGSPLRLLPARRRTAVRRKNTLFPQRLRSLPCAR